MDIFSTSLLLYNLRNVCTNSKYSVIGTAETKLYDCRVLSGIILSSSVWSEIISTERWRAEENKVYELMINNKC